ncbi:glucose-6-phosphate dehydrogenase [uncultured Pseudoteredinibacter sp.]|uniref:glucose-6-phosphate dehydrogenase n=1 Tax=uncultured Pseudoteredinibacter sp. TaxID=1641701 RepID=UPI00260EEC4B|nr:glucose-6-phosphate dehydrogenase [uncultured Pseudoteredinibacter sp.]
MSNKTDIVIFGGTGDLSERKLIPALFRAHQEGSLDEDSRIIITTRQPVALENYFEELNSKLENYLAGEDVFSRSGWESFKTRILPILLDVSCDGDQWQELANILNAQAEHHRVYYLAIPPDMFSVCCRLLSEHGLCNGNSRVVVEKPLGYDEASAEAINEDISRFFPENNIYRIDHYLGKETVQNLLALRFANQIFAQLWDGRAIDHVQISISETVGLEGRVSFYDEVGALRDMVQNHLLQLLCLVAMEPPNKLDANSIRTEKIKVLEALRPIKTEDMGQRTVRGQYVAGQQNNEMVPGYLEELENGSDTETFVALKCFIDNWRWSEVPFYLRTGKRLKQRCAEIVIQFKTTPHRVYAESAGNIDPNRLVIRLQEEELIELSITSKNMQSIGVELEPVKLNLNYNKPHGDAYMRLLIDVIANDPALFIHRDEIRAAWRWIDPIINGWSRNKQSPHLYRAGSWGPEAANELIQRDGRDWFNAGENQ